MTARYAVYAHKYGRNADDWEFQIIDEIKGETDHEGLSIPVIALEDEDKAIELCSRLNAGATLELT